MKVSAILDHIDGGHVALPEFQRGYVWTREQVRALMSSLYRRYPVGGLLMWATQAEGAPGVIKLLLDGQQRITSLYGIIRGRPPRFFDGNAQAFTGLHFHLEEEAFAFYSARMKDDPLWIDVTGLMQAGPAATVKPLLADTDRADRLQVYLDRLNAIDGIKQIDFHVEEVTGEDKTVGVVVEIFNRVNSGGTKLSKGDLALAKVCAAWPEAREEMKARLAKWQRAGFDFRLELLMRCITTITTGQAMFEHLERVGTERFKTGVHEAEKAVDLLLGLIGSRLGLDHDRVLGSRYSFPVMARYLAKREFKLSDHRERDKLLYWYVHTFLWGRYASSTETFLNYDLALMAEGDRPLDRLIADLRRNRGDLRVSPEDFLGASRGARFYPLLYLLTRVGQARDWASGIDLTMHLLGKLSRLEVHHIFPKALLYRHGYERSEVNALANFTFLTQETNLRVSNRDPAEYLPEFEQRQPGVLQSHWIPMDPELWRLERYREFLAARRELLAQAANEFLDGLLAGQLAEPAAVPEEAPVRLQVVDEDEGEGALAVCNAWVAAQGLEKGEEVYPLVDEESGAELATFDLAWPEGLQPGLSQRAAIILEGDAATLKAAGEAGYRVFADLDAFRFHVTRDVLGLEEDEAQAA